MYVKRSSILLLLIVVPLLTASKWPSYLHKCKNDEHFSECFFERAKANVIGILKGEPSLNIASYFPAKVPFKIDLGTNDLKFELDKAIITPPADTIVTEAKWDMNTKIIYMKFEQSKLIWEFDYIFEGNVLGKQVNDKGRGKKVDENIWFSLQMEYEIVQVDGVDHAKIKGGKCDYGAQKITYTFENEEINEFLSQNSKEFDQIVHPQVAGLVLQLAIAPFSAIFAITPYNKLFI